MHPRSDEYLEALAEQRAEDAERDDDGWRTARAEDRYLTGFGWD